MTEFVMAISIPLRGIRKGGTVGKPVPGVQMSLYEDLVAAWVPAKHEWLWPRLLGQELVNRLGRQKMFKYCAYICSNKSSWCRVLTSSNCSLSVRFLFAKVMG